jgi:DNA-binding PadR family transcriptional regulator
MSAESKTLLPDLSGFQRDLLVAVGECEDECGLGVKNYLEDAYGVDVNHGRLYPNLNDLCAMGLVEKGERDRRTNWYRLSERGRSVTQTLSLWHNLDQADE